MSISTRQLVSAILLVTLLGFGRITRAEDQLDSELVASKELESSSDSALLPPVALSQKSPFEKTDDNLFIKRIRAFLLRGEDAKAMALLRLMFAQERRQRLTKCQTMFSVEFCRNNSPQPFHLWAKVAARDLTRDPSDELQRRIFEQMAFPGARRRR